MNRSLKFASFFLLFTTIPALEGAAQDVKNNYITDPATGVRYLFIKHNSAGGKPVMGDIAYIRILFKRNDDSLLFDSHAGKHTDSESVFPLTLKPAFHGSLEQGIALMAAGDSASFLICADSLYMKSFRFKEFPHFVKKGSDLKFYVKLVRFETPDQLKAEEYAKVEKHRAELNKVENSEADSIEKYLTRNKLRVKPTMVDSFYVLERTGLQGRPVEDGDSLIIKYTGMFLNGKVFDQSDKGDGGKGTYKILYKRNANLIRGWLEVLPTLHEGEKVRLLLPSSMAYGVFGAGNIPAFTPLIFEIEVIKVISPFDK